MSGVDIDLDCPSCLRVLNDKYDNRCPLCARMDRPGLDFVIRHDRGGMALPAGHHAEFKCMDGACGHFIWMPRPENEKRQRRASGRHLVEQYGSGFCQMCRIQEYALMPPGAQLVAHHVVEVQEGGGDERENVWVLCPSCHALVHHERTYRGFYRVAKEGAA